MVVVDFFAETVLQDSMFWDADVELLLGVAETDVAAGTVVTSAPSPDGLGCNSLQNVLVL